METYDPKIIEPKWQKYWLENKTFATDDTSSGKKMYVLDMFPYPSGDGLHVGHAKIYTGSDIVARYMRLKGFNVLHPTGWDAFGLPTENSAIKKKVHPAALTAQNIERFRGQMQRLGLSYDWDREINTTDPAYYKWTQWIFLQLFRMGLAYQAVIPINWCPSCKTGLANEEVIDAKCERCSTPVEQRPLRQWILRITKYADRLVQGLSGVDWPPHIKEMQANWIGKSTGVEVIFTLDKMSAIGPRVIQDEKLEVRIFTTRVDTLYGASYVVLAPDHPLVPVVTEPTQKEAVEKYKAEVADRTERERTEVTREKTGVFTGGYARHPLTGQQLPIWIADYVLTTYGTGAVMGVPAHDERDFAFATKYNLPVLQVITPKTYRDDMKLPYTGDGILINSSQHDGLSMNEAQGRITSILQQRGLGRKSIQYKLRDWVFSRQRYWGEPIPVVHCEKCGIVPVREEDLPVMLPEVTHYEPTGTGESPLAAMEKWVNVKCPTCALIGRRETNTMPQWAGSSWYFLRYIDPKNSEAFAGKKAIHDWMPVDVYFGGVEHAVLHLLYARFWTKALFDAGLIPYDEPFARFRNVGLVMGEDGQKMSKSRGNVINPDDVIGQYGADTLRVYEMFLGPVDFGAPWKTRSIAGAHRFLKKTWTVVLTLKDKPDMSNTQMELEQKLQQTIKRVSEGIEQIKFNTAISSLMEFVNALSQAKSVEPSILGRFVVLLSPFAPHMAEELWQQLGQIRSVGQTAWPAFNREAAQVSTIQVPVQVNGKVRATMSVAVDITEASIVEQAGQVENVQKYLAGKTIDKIIYVPQKLLSLVVK